MLFPTAIQTPACIELTYNLTLERNNLQLGLQQRLFFDISGQPNTMEVVVMAVAEQETCTTFTVYVVVRNGFTKGV